MNARRQHIYKIKFIESGYIRNGITISNINKGSVKDKLAPMVCGVACIGEAKKSLNPKEYNLWVNMIKRCYDSTCPAYKWYGEKGVTVCDRWHRFDYFLEDIKNITGYDENKFRGGELKLDKDICSGTNNYDDKEYSLENCMFVSHLVNMKECAKRYNTTKSIKHVVYPDGKDEIINNLSDFCRKHEIDYRTVYYILDGKMKQTKGFRFYYEKCND